MGNLVQMGFSEEDCVTVLSANGGDLEAAAEYLIAYVFFVMCFYIVYDVL